MKIKSKKCYKVIILFIIILLFIMVYEIYNKRESFKGIFSFPKVTEHTNNTVKPQNSCLAPKSIITCSMLDSTNSSCCNASTTTSGQKCSWKLTYDHTGHLVNNNNGGYSCQSIN